MEVLPRPEGNLLVGVFRETLFAGGKKEARRDLERIANEHGEFMLIRKDDLGWTLAAAPAEGYLYAECLAARFGENFAYVEALGEQRAIMVVVLGGVVRADNVVSYADLKDDLITFFSEHKLDVRVAAGDIPMRREEDEADFEVFVPPADNVQSWETVEADFRNSIPLDPKAQIKPWKKARAEAMGSPIRTLMATAAVVGAIAVLATLFYPAAEAPKQAEGPPPDPLAAPYAAWSSKLSMGDAIQVASQVSWFTKKPNGWRTKTIKVGSKNTLIVIEQSSPLASLTAAARDFGARGVPTGGSKEMTVEYPVTSAARPRDRFDRVLESAAALRTFVDEVNYSSWGLAATVRAVSKGAGYSSANVFLKGTLPVIVMEAAARDFLARYPNTAVETLEYDPATASLNMTVTVFTRS